jgi:hypothetical protein
MDFQGSKFMAITSFKIFKIYILGNLQCTSLMKISFDDILFYFIYFGFFDIFLNPHFSHFLCDRHSVVISKVNYESIIFLEFIQKTYDNSH